MNSLMNLNENVLYIKCVLNAIIWTLKCYFDPHKWVLMYIFM